VAFFSHVELDFNRTSCAAAFLIVAPRAAGTQLVAADLDAFRERQQGYRCRERG